MGRRVVLGVGNLLLRDEGVGIHVIKALEGYEFPPEVEVIDGATAGCDMMPLISGAERVVIVDALQGGESPGAVYRLTPQDFKQHYDSAPVSLHDLGIMDALRMLELMDGHIPPVVIIGVEPGKIELGLELTAEVAASLPFILDLVKKEIVSQA